MMSASKLATSLLIYGYILPIFFISHLVSLATVALWNGQSLTTILQDIVVIEDDISLPHPPGHFGYVTINLSVRDEYDNSFISDASTIEDSDESILLAPHESTSDLSVIIFTSDSDDQLLDTWSKLDPDVADTGFLKDGGNTSESSLLVDNIPGILLGVDLTTNSNVIEHQEPLSPLVLGALGLENVHEDTIPVVMVTSASDEQLSALYEAKCDGSIFSISGREGLLGIPAPSWSVNSNSVRESGKRVFLSSPSPSASDASEEPDELDLTEEEEAILETLCIQVPDIVPTVEELAQNPHVPAYVPVFSRHNVNSEVVFPARKPSPSSLESIRRRSSTLSENINSMFNQMSASWTRTKVEFTRPERTGSIGSMLSSKFSEIRNVKAFNVQIQKARPERDPYDSWPWIRTAVETDDDEDDFTDDDSEEGDSIEVMFESALAYFKV